mmetsp:Transcript_18040/g.38901  ORF Transcript_18040/g.38901 Transcript_18040/m.38901 type:complete len:233 (-) Transcript_18040:179-877(-)
MPARIATMLRADLGQEPPGAGCCEDLPHQQDCHQNIICLSPLASSRGHVAPGCRDDCNDHHGQGTPEHLAPPVQVQEVGGHNLSDQEEGIQESKGIEDVQEVVGQHLPERGTLCQPAPTVHISWPERRQAQEYILGRGEGKLPEDLVELLREVLPDAIVEGLQSCSVRHIPFDPLGGLHEGDDVAENDLPITFHRTLSFEDGKVLKREANLGPRLRPQPHGYVIEEGTKHAG